MTIGDKNQKQQIAPLKMDNKIPDIPDEILAKIVKLLADDRWWLLGPILKAGSRGRDVVYRKEVLKDASIYSLCQDPSDIYTYHCSEHDIEHEGRHRRFFERCLEAGNKTSIYYEGLRVVAEERDIKKGISLLSKNTPKEEDATLACGIFSICEGNEEMVVYYLKAYGEKHKPLGSEELRNCGEEFVRELSYYRRLNNNTYKETFSFPIDDYIPFPDCAIDCAIEYGLLPNLCNNCYLWRLARKVCQML